jgi:Zn-dependent peptidase ImmA (M78 family)
MSGTFRSVSPMAPKDIENMSDDVRKMLSLGLRNVPMVHLVEKVLPEVLPGYDFFVLPDEDMPTMAGVSAVGEFTICLANSTYERLCDGDPEARLVAAHEFAHLMMHSHQIPVHAKRTRDDERVDPEWQADRFAEFWLMPRSGVLRCRSAEHVAAKYAVPIEAARRRFHEVKQVQGELFG